MRVEQAGEGEGEGEGGASFRFFPTEVFFSFLDSVGLFLLINSRSLFETAKKRIAFDLELSEPALINWRVRY